MQYQDFIDDDDVDISEDVWRYIDINTQLSTSPSPYPPLSSIFYRSLTSSYPDDQRTDDSNSGSPRYIFPDCPISVYVPWTGSEFATARANARDTWEIEMEQKHKRRIDRWNRRKVMVLSTIHSIGTVLTPCCLNS